MDVTETPAEEYQRLVMILMLLGHTDLAKSYRIASRHYNNLIYLVELRRSVARRLNNKEPNT